MISNEHIRTIFNHLAMAKAITSALPDSTDKQMLVFYLDSVVDRMLALNTDVDNAKRQINELSRYSSLPVLDLLLQNPPPPNDYNAVRIYIEQRKLIDPEFLHYCDGHTRKELCKRLSDEFDWIIDPLHLGKNINRHN